MDPLAWIDDALDALDAEHLLRRSVVREGAQRGSIALSDAHHRSAANALADRGAEHLEIINFSANDYLGLAADERLIRAAAEAARGEGWGAGASPLITGRSNSHAELERRLAAFEQTEAALVFASGFAANIGTVAALVGQGDAIYADAKNHASLIDGCRLSRA
ncbi:MAG TPA: aminotransferase class I/II-fold pyridoxal phosphate-dependent enzyme, partial [Pirellulales bacterium]